MNSIDMIKNFTASTTLENVKVCDGKYVVPLLIVSTNTFVFDSEDAERDEEILTWWTDLLVECDYHCIDPDEMITTYKGKISGYDQIRKYYNIFTTTDDGFADLRRLLIECNDFPEIQRHLSEDNYYDNDHEFIELLTNNGSDS